MPYAAQAGKASYNSMDTNGDGTVNDQDDPFEPFYPGDEYVDWVGTQVVFYG